MLSQAELLDPAACAECHPAHYAAWSRSMHAHAADDPVFLAMNARGQREAALGDFCVRCHAPVALALGETDGTSLDGVPPEHRGVTCVWCHQLDAVTGEHNAAVRFANDGWMRAAIADPDPSAPHQAGYGALQDRNDPAASAACGACHDVVTPADVHLERTYAEWQGSVFAGDGPGRQGCGHCHMPSSEGPAALDGPVRALHDHAMPGVDVALVDWPEAERHVGEVQAELDRALLARLCVLPLTGGTEVTLRLEGVALGHGFPSGSSHDRRVWAEVIAWRGEDEVLRTGVVPDGEAVVDVDDPLRWELHDVVTDATGAPAHMFWEVAEVSSRALPVSTTTDPTDPAFDHGREARWPLPGVEPDRVEARVRVRPIGLEILDDLIESGDLDPAVRSAMPTFDLGSTVLTWEGGVGSCVGG